jgi:nitrite reductase (NO-forming)
VNSEPIGLTNRPAARRMRGGSDRRVTIVAIGIAAVFMAVAVLAVLIPAAARLGSWLPLHLLFAGAASTAIAGVMPFFSVAVSGAPPAHAPVRLLGVLGIAAGAAMLIVGRGFWPAGVSPNGATVAGLGGLVYLLGLAATAASTLLPLRVAIGRRRIFMGVIYGLALMNAALGASLATAFLLGWTPVVAAWAVLRPAHAWLNLFGFISLVIAGSLLHLLPTVAGAQIARTRASVVSFVALAFGPPLVAAGFVLSADAVTVLGAAVTVTGALSLAWHGATVLRSRARWTTDPSWHLFTTWSLAAAIVWFVAASLIAAAQIVAGGSAAAWNLDPQVVPLGIGWAGQALIGAWSHLVPAIGPGSPEQHARQRAVLGRAGAARFLLLNLGAGLAVAGTALNVEALEVLGIAFVLACGAGALFLLGAALVVLRRPAGPRVNSG